MRKMKANIVPLRFRDADEKEFYRILDALKEIYQEEVSFLEPRTAGDELPEDADAVLFPVMWTNVYTEMDKLLRTIHVPSIVLTTTVGVSLMFDWEAVAYMKQKGLQVFNPHSVELAKTVFKALALKRDMKHQKFLVFHDSKGEGLIPEQFKIFYWWNDECIRDMKEKFGITIVHKSYKALGEKARLIPDDAAREEMERWDFQEEVPYERPVLSAVKLFMAIRDEVDAEGDVVGCGANCLNEGFFSETTPCLAWSLLYQDRGIFWVCESDTSSLMTEYLIGSTIDCSLFTTNIYPFLSGMPALSHEKIQEFPDVADPDDHALLVHCGYLGCVAQAMAKKWTLRPPVLGWHSWNIVGENSIVVDAEVETGDITLCKLRSDFNGLFVEKAVLEEYVQYPGSDCRNGGLIRVPDGYKLMEDICSHHMIVTTGKRTCQMKAVAEIFGLEVF
ncbi:hypothetical protein [Enterocloster hominis (ex Hitch et al. 2024)]|uniref:L-fucose isomerase and related proteins n=1 Tax=Enterocloster hominis (ex Hitch et al. 2024) TaxID=1917870 RepID=A0ABV1D128_9FIRM